jgi:UPF0755 protein
MSAKKIVLIVLAVSIGVGMALIDSKIFKPWRQLPKADAPTTLLEIPKGSGGAKISRILQDKGFVKSPLEWKIFCKMRDCSKLQAGVFEVREGTGLEHVVEKIREGRSATRKVVIPEGRASWEIFSLLKQSYPKLDSLRWEELVHSSTFAKELGVPHSTLEGFLFPDTYPMPWQADEKDLIRIMVRSFFKTWEALPKEKSEVYRKHGFLGTVTLASVVEEETAVEKERTRIAGVFWNRLQKGWPLGADPTVRFIFRSLTGPIYKSQLNSDNPYNTRKFKGLPPGPVSNPGKASLQAALMPGETDALYFVGKDDGSREHFFTTRLQDHNKYKDVAAKNRGE